MRYTRRRFLQSTAAAAASAALLAASPGMAAAIPTSGPPEPSPAPGPFQPTWESLTSQYKCPDWYRDAKFGIWAHWSAQCVPEQGDWYARFMYMEGHPDYEYHVKTYGHPSVVGFKDIDHRWHAENWQPERLIARYKAAGAKYFMSLANHHDNFDTFDSRYHAWNAVNIGPKRDIIAGWSRAARAAGLPLGVSVHAAHAWSWFEVAQGSDTTGQYMGVSYDGTLTKADGRGQWWQGYDPQALYAQYGHPPNKELQWDPTASEGASAPSAAFMANFVQRSMDLIDRYDPDLVYYDDTVMPFYPLSESIGLTLTSHFYNRNIARRGGKLEAVQFTKGADATQRRMAVLDIERGGADHILPDPWQTDTCIGQWHYSRAVYESHSYKTPRYVIQTLVDVVSKNGNLLLSIPVRGDGTIDPDEEKFLDGLTAWMPIGGDAIFGTRPWRIYGEGPSTAAKPAGGAAANFTEDTDVKYTPQDIRFTAKSGDLYAIALAWPDTGQLIVTSLASNAPYPVGAIRSVRLLGVPGTLKFVRDARGLVIDVPAKPPCDHAYALVVEGAAV